MKLTDEREILAIFAENGLPVEIIKYSYGNEAIQRPKHVNTMFDEQFDILIDLEIYFKAISLPSELLSIKIGLLPLDDVQKFVTGHLNASRTMLGYRSAYPYLNRLKELKEKLSHLNA